MTVPTTSSFFFFSLALLLVSACLVQAQTTSPRPSTAAGAAGGTDDVCAEIERLSNEIDALVYETEGAGAPLQESQVDWDQVQTYLAPNFTWNDYSAFSTRGNYSDYRAYWTALNAANSQWALQDVSTEQWVSCDPVAMREISQWRETFASTADPTRQEVSTSIYVIEFDSDLKATRQAYWTSGNIANLVRGQP